MGRSPSGGASCRLPLPAGHKSRRAFAVPLILPHHRPPQSRLPTANQRATRTGECEPDSLFDQEQKVNILSQSEFYSSRLGGSVSASLNLISTSASSFSSHSHSVTA